MAGAVVKFVLKKLDKIITDEIKLLGGVKEQVKQVQSELTRIQCCLKDADSACKGDARMQNWLNELRNVAYRIEDATDTYFLEVEDHRQKDPSFLKKLFNKPCQVPILHKLGTELGKIQKELEVIFKRRTNYRIELMQDKGKGDEVIMPLRRATYQDLDETEVIGLHADKSKILEQLVAKGTLRRAVITIVGTGGLGKTTLAHMVYKSARAYFGYYIMLSISQQFSLMDLLRKMVSKYDHYVPEKQDVDYYVGELKKFLCKTRYLIILDDVWEVNLWNQLKDVLPDVKNGSRIMMTSRFVDVAKSADSEMKPYQLRFLDDMESRDLLLKKALPYQELGESYPSELLELAGELSKTCNGLPLALKVVGGILSSKEKSYHVWARVLRTMNWQSDGKDCMQVLSMSYEDLPYYLKTCFLYLASFPEHYKISAKRLIRLWVAEGFIPQEQRKTMEENAADCLEELFQRSMIQVSSRCMSCSIKRFQVHDLLRDLAVHVAGQENFFTILSEALYAKNPSRVIRRASLPYPHQEQQWDDMRLQKYVGANIRSLLLFEFVEFPECSYFRLLKVLELVDVTGYQIDKVKGLDELIHLKYLGFINCTITISSCSFRRMKTLETLDLRGTTTKLTPSVLWKISTLRHVLLDKVPGGNNFDGPKGGLDLRNLQTMRWVCAHGTWAKNLPLLNNLCKLGVSNIYEDWITVTNLLQMLPSLVSLGIIGTSLPKEIVYPEALPNYSSLQSLYLQGKCSLTEPLKADSFPPHLVKLTLIGSQLEQNPMLELGKLKSLKKLCLREKVTNYSDPTICLEGFPVLQYLEVVDRRIKDFKVGVMPNLTYLRAHEDLKLQFLENGVMPKLTNVQVRSRVYIPQWRLFHLPGELTNVTLNFNYC